MLTLIKCDYKQELERDTQINFKGKSYCHLHTYTHISLPPLTHHHAKYLHKRKFVIAKNGYN